MKIKIILLISLTCLTGCSVAMEASRPDPIDLSKFTPGMSHVDVVAQLGISEGNVKEGDLSCDIYKLYTHGPNGLGKGAIAVGEGAADVFTLGLAEVLLTPAEGVTSAKKHTVMFCYGADDKLVRVTESP